MGEIKVLKGNKTDPRTCPRCGMPLFKPQTPDGERFVERVKRWLMEFKEEMEEKGF